MLVLLVVVTILTKDQLLGNIKMMMKREVVMMVDVKELMLKADLLLLVMKEEVEKKGRIGIGICYISSKLHISLLCICIFSDICSIFYNNCI